MSDPQLTSAPETQLKTSFDISDDLFKAIVVLVPRDYNISNKSAEKSSLVQQNQAVIPGLQINDIWWLDHGLPRPESILRDLVIEFPTAAFAEAAIRERFVVLGASWRRHYLDSRLDLEQCSCCWQYGHIISACEHLHLGKICRYCAKTHGLTRCISLNCPILRKCAVCRGAHESADERCHVRQQQRSATIGRLRAKQETTSTPAAYSKEVEATAPFKCVETPTADLPLSNGPTELTLPNLPHRAKAVSKPGDRGLKGLNCDSNFALNGDNAKGSSLERVGCTEIKEESPGSLQGAMWPRSNRAQGKSGILHMEKRKGTS